MFLWLTVVQLLVPVCVCVWGGGSVRAVCECVRVVCVGANTPFGLVCVVWVCVGSLRCMYLLKMEPD